MVIYYKDYNFSIKYFFLIDILTTLQVKELSWQ